MVNIDTTQMNYISKADGGLRPPPPSVMKSIYIYEVPYIYIYIYTFLYLRISQSVGNWLWRSRSISGSI